MTAASCRRAPLLGLVLAGSLVLDVRGAEPFRLRRLEIWGDGRPVPAESPLPSGAGGLRVGDRFHPATLQASGDPAHHPPSVPAPRIEISRWHQSDGLPANKVRSVLRTQDGRLWVGTVGGLAVFDGVGFTLLDETNSPALASEGSIGRHLLEAANGALWIGTERGVLCRRDEAFVAFPGQDQVRGLKIHQLAERHRGGLWVGSDRGLGWLDGEGFHPVTSAGTAPVHCVAEVAGGPLWFSSGQHLRAVDPATGQGIRSLGPEESPWRRGDDLRYGSLMVDRERRLWVGANQGAAVLEHPGAALRPIEAPDTTIAARFTPDDGGLIRLLLEVPDPGAPVHLMALDRHTHGVVFSVPLPHRSGCAAVADPEGSLWTGGPEGLIRIHPSPLTSVRLPPLQSRIPMGAVDVDPDGVLWFSTAAQLGCWSGRELTFLQLHRVVGPVTQQTFRPFVVSGPFERVWFGSGEMELLSLPISSLEGRSSEPLSRSLAHLGPMRAATRGGHGDLWVAGESGVFRITGPNRAESLAGFNGSDAQNLLEDSQGRLWIGCRSGRLEEHRVDGSQPPRVHLPGSAFEILALAERAAGGVWLGTSSGLACFAGDRCRHMGPDAGIAAQRIQGVREDGQGGLWLAGDSGVLHATLEAVEHWLNSGGPAPRWTTLGLSDGLDTLAGIAGSQGMALGKDGRLWISRDECLVAVNPATWSPPPLPRLRLDSYRLGNAWHPVPPGASAALPGFPPESPLELRFHAPTLLPPERLAVEYRLGGSGLPWQPTGKDRIVRLSGLAAGTRILEVRSRPAGSSASGEILSVPLAVVPGWGSTWSFRAGVGSLALGAVAGIMGWRLHRQRRVLESARHAELERERLRIARDLHDHLGAHLAGAALGSERRHGRDPGSGVQESLEALHEVIWTLQPQQDHWSGLVDHLADVAHRMAASSGLELDLELPDPMPSIPVPGTWRREVSALIRETLRNVITHARATRVRIRFVAGETGFLLEVGDDGRGMPTSAGDPPGPGAGGRRGRGLPNLQSRCQDLGGTCGITSVPGGGVSVVFTLPWPESGGRAAAGRRKTGGVPSKT